MILKMIVLIINEYLGEEWMIKAIIKLGVTSTAFVFLFNGCSAKIEHLPGSKETSKYAPVNAQEQYGIVSYRNQGISAVREARRENAYKEMYNTCNGKYKIINESNQNDGAVFVSNNNGGGYMQSTSRIYIKFICVN